MRKPTEMVMLPCACGAEYPIICPAHQVGKSVACPWSGTPTVVRRETPFGAGEWEGLSSHRVLVAAVWGLGLELSERKALLFACGVARCALNWKQDDGSRLAIECGEALADGRTPPLPPHVARRGLQPGRAIGDDPEFRVALRCLETPAPRRPTFGGQWGGYEAPELAVFRDLVPNPFLPLTWNPDWFTSTVRDLARTMYEAHEFGVMPILADALQDAGCDDEQILNHCRGARWHARGCWVLDAILGKS
jgi:hypothetical protein